MSSTYAEAVASRNVTDWLCEHPQAPMPIPTYNAKDAPREGRCGMSTRTPATWSRVSQLPLPFERGDTPPEGGQGGSTPPAVGNC